MIVSHEQLLSMTGVQQPAALRRALKKAGIPFREHNGRLFTTVDAITATLVGRGKKHDKTRPNFDGLAAAGQDQARVISLCHTGEMDEAMSRERRRKRAIWETVGVNICRVSGPPDDQ